MELTLTQAQKQYLNKKGVISASSLQKAYTASVKEQLALKNAAEKMRKAKNASK